MPAAPAPAIARPTINVVLSFATAQIKDPISKMKIDSRYVYFSEKNLYPLPHVDWNEANVRKNADPYQPTWSSEWNSSVISGMAVATMVMSRATRNMDRIKAMTMKTRLAALGYSPSSSAAGVPSLTSPFFSASSFSS